jgi:hypothetical protein
MLVKFYILWADLARRDFLNKPLMLVSKHEMWLIYFKHPTTLNVSCVSVCPEDLGNASIFEQNFLILFKLKVQVINFCVGSKFQIVNPLEIFAKQNCMTNLNDFVY